MFWFFILGIFALTIAAAYLLKQRQRELARQSARREAEMLALMRTAPRTAGGSAGAQPAAATEPAAPRRDKFLTGSRKLAYYLLKLGLPEHEIFSRVRLADLVPEDGGNRQAAPSVDFVVCTRDMDVAAAVLVDDAGADGLQRAMVEKAAEILGAAGLRCVRLHPGRLPDRKEVRAVVLGAV